MDSTKPEAHLGNAGRSPLVLVVDDEPGVSKVMLFVLRKVGCRGMAVADPREALRLMELREFVPVLLITDHAMPYMSGLELLRRSTELIPGLKSILCTGEVADSELAAAAVLPDRVLEKPFGTRALMETVQSLLPEISRAP
jgi:CheY-like chemotaxis protein